jgi:hypothetical protein
MSLSGRYPHCLSNTAPRYLGAMDDRLSHLPPVLRAAARRLPRGARKDGGEGSTPAPRNNYVADAPKKPAGARPGNRNALKHGRFTAENRARHAALAALIEDLRQRAAILAAQAETLCQGGRNG